MKNEIRKQENNEEKWIMEEKTKEGMIRKKKLNGRERGSQRQ